jgi:hypothetical protein
MALQFAVLISEPELPDNGGFILTHYAGKRRKGHPAFERMFQWFQKEDVAELNRRCDTIKRRLTTSAGGGDPDLFAYGLRGDRFFVEVKDQDDLIAKQQATFPTIAAILHCDVLVARVKAVSGAKPGDGLALVSRPANKALQPTSHAKGRAKSTRRTRVARG